MRNVIEKKEIERMAELACLTFTEEETERLAREMEGILSFARELSADGEEELSVEDGVETDRLRKDVPASGMPREELLSAAPHRREDYIAVPRILGE